jgi:hypothetical protein
MRRDVKDLGLDLWLGLYDCLPDRVKVRMNRWGSIAFFLRPKTAKKGWISVTDWVYHRQVLSGAARVTLIDELPDATPFSSLLAPQVSRIDRWRWGSPANPIYLPPIFEVDFTLFLSGWWLR